MAAASEAWRPIGAAALLITAMSAGESSARSVPDAEGLDYAFRFATAIASDPKDRARAQEDVVRDLIALGEIDRAIERAARVEGWRQGVVYADIAAELARQGRKQEAASFVSRAEQVRGQTEGWQNPRISAHVAQARAVSGESEAAHDIVAKLAVEDAQYAGRATAILARSQAAKGEFETAMKTLEGLAGSSDADVAWWRASGYLAIAKDARLKEDERRRALSGATQAAHAIPGWKQAEALQSIAGTLEEQGQRRQARTLLLEAEEIVLAQPATMPLRSALLSNLARSMRRSGEEGRSAALLRLAEKGVENADLIERPGLLASVASGYVDGGNQDEAKRLYGRSLDAAGALVNARPRALALVEICRSMGREKLSLDPATRERLDAMLAGLKEPW